MQNYTRLPSVPSWHVIGTNLLFYHHTRFHIVSTTTEVLSCRDTSVSSPSLAAVPYVTAVATAQDFAYCEVRSVKNTSINIWLNYGVY